MSYTKNPELRHNILVSASEKPVYLYQLNKEKHAAGNSLLKTLKWLVAHDLLIPGEPGCRKKIEYTITPKGLQVLQLVDQLKEKLGGDTFFDST